jgi:thiol-disulfide isomerase/thioredoxin
MHFGRQLTGLGRFDFIKTFWLALAVGLVAVTAHAGAADRTAENTKSDALPAAQSSQTSGNTVPKYLQEMRKQLAEEEIPGSQIAWRMQDAFDSYMQAVELKRPLVLFFHADNCGFCQKMILTVMQCPEIQRYAGIGVFSLTDPEFDEGGQAMAKALSIERYPTAVVLMPDPDKIHVIGRMEGEFPSAKVIPFLERAFEQVESVQGVLAEIQKIEVPPGSTAACLGG